MIINYIKIKNKKILKIKVHFVFLTLYFLHRSLIFKDDLYVFKVVNKIT